MRTHALLPVLLLVLMVHAIPTGATPAHLWSQRFGDSSTQFAYAAAVDAAGNIIIVGSEQGTVNFGGSNLTSAGGYDAFIAKFDPNGVHEWSQRFGDASDQNPQSVAIDASGNIIMAGYFMGTVNFGGTNLTSLGSNDIFVVKFTSSGAHVWSKRFGDASEQRAAGVAVDAAGNVDLTGFFLGTLNFGGSNLVASGQYDIFLAQFNSGGTHVWSQRFGDPGFQYGIGVATDGASNILLTGSMEGVVNFGGSDLTSAGGADIYLAKFNSAGVHQWSQRFGDASGAFQQGRSVTADASNNVILGGTFDNTVDFGGGPLVTNANPDVFVAKFNSAGVHQWSQRFGDPGSQGFYAVAVDPAGNIAVTGQYNGTIDFGGGALTSVGNSNMYLASLTPAGAHRWSARYGGSMNPAGLVCNASGNIISAGWVDGTVNFGGTTFTSGGSDIYIAKFGDGPGEPHVVKIVDVPNDQGRHVKIRFTKSGGDDASAANPVESYEAFRRSDPAPALAARGSMLPAPATTGWMFVASVPAHAEDNYEMEAPTLADSTLALGDYNSVFFVRAATGAPSVYYDSPPDSGSSVDNLAPGVPQSFAFSSGVLSWDESRAADFDYFTVYGSNTNSFAGATLIDYTVATQMNVAASPYTYYFATATDFSGNEGKPAVVNTLSGVGGTPASYVLSVSAYPNPFNPETTIRYTLPSKGRVSIAVYDARGALVRTLLSEEKPAGAFTTRWEGRNDAGSIVGSGVYFARITHVSGTKSYKMVLLK